MNTRRQFLIHAPIALAGVSAACRDAGQGSASDATTQTATPGAPVAFGTPAASGPPVTPATFAEAEKLTQTPMTESERTMAAASWRRTMAPYLERRVGPKKVDLAPELSPATLWDPAR